MCLVSLLSSFDPLESPVVGSCSMRQNLMFVLIIGSYEGESSGLQAASIILTVHAVSSLALARLDVSLGPLGDFTAHTIS